MHKDPLKQRPNSLPSPSKTILYQIIKGHYIALHNTPLLAQENMNLHAANEKVVKKRTWSTKQIPYERGLTIEEGLQVIALLDLRAAEAPAVDSHAQGELPIQPDQPAKKGFHQRVAGAERLGTRLTLLL